LGGPAIYRVSVALPRGDKARQHAEARPLARTAYRFKLAPGDVERELAGLVRLQYLLGERVELSGYRLPEGRTLSQDGLALTLYWDVLAEMEEGYSVFVHLVGSDGSLLGQGDGPPLGGDYPTSAWAAGEVLADARVVRLNADLELETLPAGAYLLVGLYRLEDGVRLPVVDKDGARMPQDAVRIELD
jgi:hypothetical protein